MGFNNVAINSSHSYVSKNKNITPKQLKGSDKVFCELAQANGAKAIDICAIYHKNQRVFRAEILDVITLDDAFNSLYYRRDDSEEEGDEQDEEEKEHQEQEEANEGDDEEEDEVAPSSENKEEKEEACVKIIVQEAKLKRQKLDYDNDVTPNFDNENIFVALKDEYRLGMRVFVLCCVCPICLCTGCCCCVCVCVCLCVYVCVCVARVLSPTLMSTIYSYLGFGTLCVLNDKMKKRHPRVVSTSTTPTTVVGCE